MSEEIHTCPLVKPVRSLVAACHRGALILPLLLFGCATTYQSDGATGGYSETQLDENVFVVHFSGNGFTKKARAADFALLRSSELTLEHGYKYFVIIEKIFDLKASEMTQLSINQIVQLL